MTAAKVTDLTATTTLAVGDLLPLVDISDTAQAASGSLRKSTLATLITYLQSLGLPRTKKVGSTHSNSTVTGTKVTDLDLTLEAGTYMFDYRLIVRSATATTGPMIGVNFSGTAAVKTMICYWGDASGSLLAEAHNMDDQGVLGTGLISGMVNKAYTTTSPNMGTTIGTATAASDTPMFVQGLVIVTASGNLELWHSSETTTATTIEVGSSLSVIRTA